MVHVSYGYPTLATGNKNFNTGATFWLIEWVMLLVWRDQWERGVVLGHRKRCKELISGVQFEKSLITENHKTCAIPYDFTIFDIEVVGTIKAYFLC